MAFNVVDQQNNHRGIVLGRFVFDKELVKTASGVVWLVGLTNYRIEDVGISINSIEQHWAKQWRLKNDYGINNAKFKERINIMLKIHSNKNLNYEESLRFIHTWHSWQKMRGEVEGRIEITGYVLIDPLKCEYRDNKIMIDMPNQYPNAVENDNLPVYMQIIAPPVQRVLTLSHEGVRIYHLFTDLSILCGNTEIELSLPFVIGNARKNDFMQVFFTKEKLSLVYANGFFYKQEYKKWGLFG